VLSDQRTRQSCRPGETVMVTAWRPAISRRRRQRCAWRGWISANGRSDGGSAGGCTEASAAASSAAGWTPRMLAARPGHLHTATTAIASGLQRAGLPLASEEDDMPSTLNPTCPLCGLRFTGRPLLELHIREDHLQRSSRAEPDHDDPGDARASQPRVRGLFPLYSLGSGLLPTTDEVMTTTSTRRPRRSRSGWAVTTLRRALRTLRYLNQELTGASEAIARSARAPQIHPGDVPAHFPLTNGLTAAIDSTAVRRPARPGGPRTVQEPDATEGMPPAASPAIRAKDYDAHHLHEPAGP
jgi:hypothetical protein